MRFLIFIPSRYVLHVIVDNCTLNNNNDNNHSQGTATAATAQQYQYHTTVAGRKTHQRHQMAVCLVSTVYGESFSLVLKARLCVAVKVPRTLGFEAKST